MGGVSTTVHDAGNGAGQHLAGFLGIETELGVGRGYASVWHGVHLVLDARAADRWAFGEEPRALVPADRPLTSRGTGLTISNRLRGDDWSLRLDVRQGYEAAEPVAGMEPLDLRLFADTSWWGAEGSTSGTTAAWGRVRLGPGDGPRLLGGVGHADLDERATWLRTTGPQRATALALEPEAVATTVEGRFVVPVGRLTATYGAWVDPVDTHLLAQEGGLAYEGDCDCWRASIRASQLRGRTAPDLWLSVALGPGS